MRSNLDERLLAMESISDSYLPSLMERSDIIPISSPTVAPSSIALYTAGLADLGSDPTTPRPLILDLIDDENSVVFLESRWDSSSSPTGSPPETTPTMASLTDLDSNQVLNPQSMPYIDSMRGFRHWVMREGRDIFGFRRDREQSAPEEPQDEPIIGISSDVVVEYMMSRPIRGFKPVALFSNEIQWGEGTGAVKMKLSPMGSFKVMIRKLQPNLEGVQTWVCKRIVSYKEIFHSTRRFDEGIAEDMMEIVEGVESQDINAPDPEYDGIEGLTRRMARRVSRPDVMPEIFIYMGVRPAKNPNNWLIVFECRGHGVEAPEGHRLEQFHINMSHNPATGMIRCFGQNIESHKKVHEWAPQPSEWDEYFSTSQPEDEIIGAVASAFMTF